MSRKKKKTKKQKLSSIERNIPLNEFPFDIGSEIKKAVQYHRSGELEKAEKIYKKILKINPNHSETLYLLGVTTHQLGNNDLAVNLIKKAIQNDPQNPTYYNYLGNVFKDKNELNEAISCYQKALQLKSDYAGAYYNLGTIFQHRGDLNEAISCYQKALHLKSDYIAASYNIGIAFHDLGKLSKAIFCYQKTIQLKPDQAEPYYNIGNALQKQGKLNEAISYYQKAIQLKPDYIETHNNLGITFYYLGKLNEAISCFHKALQLKPDYAEASNNLGNAFLEQDKLSEAISCYKKALQLKPDLAIAYYGMGNVLQEQGKIDEAISYLENAIQLKPELNEAYSHLVFQLQRTCAWQRLEGLTDKLDASTRKALDEGVKPTEAPFISIARHSDLSHNFAIAKSWSNDIDRAMSKLEIQFLFDEKRLYKRKIAVGYLSNDFCNHPVAHLMLSLFGLHNRDEFEIFCYSYGKDDGSYYRTRIKQDCDKFVDIRMLNHTDAAKCIYEDQVDILVDLMGHTRNNRLSICALRPAPIQVSYLGFPGTTGADFFNYIITDRIVTPKDHAPYYSEKFVYLSHCYQVNDYTQAISNKDFKKADFGLPEGSFTFCSFNQAYKIERIIFNVWMNILLQVPESVLWLSLESKTAEKNLRHEAELRGLKPERLIFSNRLPIDEHLKRLKLADLALDTQIYNGGATTSNALWAGVPVITLQGSHFASRMSASILTAIGLTELITYSLEEYETLAVRLTCNPEELQAIRQKLDKNRLVAPLFDTPRFVRNLETAYKEMWKIFLAGERPRQIDVVDG